jgi:hypothetical protein
MEDDLKILNVEYLSNHLLDHTQISNLSLNEQTIFKIIIHSNEDNLQWKMNSKY